MKKALLVISFIFFTGIVKAQIPEFTLRLDSIPLIEPFSLNSQGNLNIVESDTSLKVEVTLVIVTGKQVIQRLNYASIAEFNKSDATEQIRKIAKPGGRFLIEYIFAKGNIIINRPIVE